MSEAGDAATVRSRHSMAGGVTALTDRQIRDYRANGYLSPLVVLSGEEALACRRHFESVESDPGLRDLPRSVGKYLRSCAHLVMPEVFDIASRPKILDAVSGLLGPDLMVYSAEFFIKEPGTADFVSWHQDLTYWGLGETDEEVTAWVALSAASIEAGCMRFIPGSHKQRILEHRDTFDEHNALSRGQVVASDIDESAAVRAPLDPGQCSLHHGRLFHASSPNRSADRRIGLAIRYVTPAVRQLVAQRDYAMLVRGADRHRNWINLAPPVRAFEPEALVLYEQVLAGRAEALARNAEQELGILRKG